MEVNALPNKENATNRTPRNQRFALTDKLHMIKTKMDLPILIELLLHLQLLKKKKRRLRKRKKRRLRKRKRRKQLLLK